MRLLRTRAAARVVGPLFLALFLTLPPSAAAGPLADMEKEIAVLVDRVAPSVVSVRAQLGSGMSERQGTGFIWDAGGYIATTADVVQGARRLRVFFNDRREMMAELVGEDAFSNLALLRVQTPPGETARFTPAKRGDSMRTRPGSWALTVGNLVGLDHSLSLGIIAGTERLVVSGERSFTALLQIAGALGPGASGAPVFNAAGEIIGIMAASVGYPGGSAASFRPEPPASDKDASPVRGQATGVGGNLSRVRTLPGILEASGFAIPIHTAQPILSQLREHGRITAPWVGVMLLPASKDETGILIYRVAQRSPAYKGGLRPGDRILSANGKPVDPKARPALPSGLKAGDVLVILVQRGEKQFTARVAIETRPDTPTPWIDLVPSP